MKKKIYKVAVISEAGEVENIILAPEGHEVSGAKTLIVLGAMCNDTDMVPIHKGRLPNIGDLWDGTTFLPRPPTVQELLAYAADVRYQKEVAGVAFAGATYPTTRAARATLAELLGPGQLPAAGAIALKIDGQFYTVSDIAALRKLQALIAEHVQACFAKEMEVADKINKGLITKRIEIDQAFT